ncbi:MAG: GNAT family N-acetyltransferase [Pyrinomonadaceae bacterium]
MEIRNYTDSDLAEILSVIKTAFAEQRGLVDPPSSAEHKTIEILRSELQGSDALVVVEEGRLIANICYRFEGDRCYFDRLAVMPDCRRRGIGKLLIEEVESRASAKGIRKMSLSVRIELENQQALYRSLGYEIESYESHEGYDRPTYVKMGKGI